MSARYTGRIVEHTWDCPYCGKENRGRDRECTGCGRPRSDSTQFNTDKHIAVLDGREAEKYTTGPDWFCEWCSSYNPAGLTECKGCGAPRTEHSKDYFKMLREIQEKEARTREEAENSTTAEPLPIKNTAISSSAILTLLAIPVIIAFIVGLIFLLKPVQMDGVVTELAWNFSVNLEEFTTLEDEGWTYPSDARVLDKTWKYKESVPVIDHYDTVTKAVTKTRQVPDGDNIWYTYEDMGNGFSREVEHKTPKYKTETYTDYETTQEPVYRNDPVYAWWYEYEYDRWLKIDTCVTSGDKGQETDPFFEITDDKHRMSSVKREYYMGVQTEEGLMTIRINDKTYGMADVGSEVKYKINKAGFVMFMKINATEVEEKGKRVNG